MANPYDIPRSSGNTFLIFSKIAVGSSTGPGVVRQTVTVEAVTGIASMSGGLNNSVLEITPNSAKTGFDVLCKARDTAGTYNFSCAVTSNGDATHEACTSYFTFQVVLFGADAVHDVIIREYRVDTVVDEELGLNPVCPIHDYRVQGALRTMDDNAYPSGLTLHVWTEDFGDYFIDHPQIYGIAERPGIYVASLDVTTWNDNYASGGSGTNFSSGTNMAVPVIVCIYEHPYQIGQLCIRIPKRPKVEHDLIRVIHVLKTVLDTYPHILERYTKSEDIWERNYTTTHYTYDGEAWYTYENFRMIIADGIWSYQARIYNSGDAVPDWTTISTADQVPGCATPPSSGWSNGVVIEGYSIGSIYSADRTVDYGFFDWKGVDEAGHTIAQQKTYWIRQFDGWSRPAEWQHNEGYIYKWDDESGGYAMFTKTGTLVLAAGALFLSEITAICVPYAPPVCEKYNTSAGDIAVRDIMAKVKTSLGMEIACNMSCPVTPGSLGIKFGDKVGGIWPFYPAHRKWVPYNGTSGDVIKTGGLTVKVESGTKVFRDYDRIYDRYTSGTSSVVSGETTTDDLQDTKKGITITLSGNMLYGRRNADIPKWFGIFGIPAVSGIYEKSRTYSYLSHVQIFDPTPILDEEDTKSITTTSTEPEVNSENRIQSILFCTACAPDYENNKEHQPWSVAVADIGGSWDADYTTHEVWMTDGSTTKDTTTTTNDSFSGTLRRVLMKPSRLLGTVESYEDKYESRTFTLELESASSYTDDTVNPQIYYYPSYYHLSESITLALDGEDATVVHSLGEKTISGYSGTTIPDFTITPTVITYTGTKGAMYTKYDELKETSLARAMPTKPTGFFPGGNANFGDGHASRDANETVTYNNYTWSTAE